MALLLKLKSWTPTAYPVHLSSSGRYWLDIIIVIHINKENTGKMINYSVLYKIGCVIDRILNHFSEQFKNTCTIENPFILSLPLSC